MQVEKNIIDILFKKYDKDRRVVEAIATHPLYFFKQIAQDLNNERPVRIRYFGLFAVKKKGYKIHKHLNKKPSRMEIIYDNTTTPIDNKIVIVKYQMGNRDDLQSVAIYRKGKFYGHYTNVEQNYFLDNILEWRYATAKDLTIM